MMERSFTHVFREVQREMQEIEARFDEMLRASEKRQSSGGFTPLVFGWTLGRGPNGLPVVQHFGNLTQEPEALREGWREPSIAWHVDEASKTLHITTELPGIEREQIKLEVMDEAVRITAKNGGRKYRAECLPGVMLDTASVKATFRNSVLDVTIKIKRSAKGKATMVKIQ